MDRARILVVEDEELVALAIKQCLERLGYEVPDIVASGEEAVKKSAALEADLVLMDIHLQGIMNGIEAASVIKDSARVPVVYLTAYSDRDTLDQAKITEPFGYILKPFDERCLEATVKMALRKSQGQKALQGTNDRMSAILHSIRDAIILTEPNGTIEYLNEKARDLFRLPEPLPPFISILPLLKTIRTDAQVPLSSYLDDVVFSAKSVRLENCEVARSDSGAGRVDVSLEPYRESEGSPRGILFVFRDFENTKVLCQTAAQGTSETRATESLIEKSEQLLRDADASWHGRETTPAEQAAPTGGQPGGPEVGQAWETADAGAAGGRSAGGRIELRVSDDKMTATASFFPPQGDGKPIALPAVQELLSSSSVRFGVDWDAVNTAIAACNSSRTRLPEVEIAHGIPPTDQVNSHLELEPSLLEKELPEKSEALAVDFKARSPFRLVKRGDLLARMVPRREGVAGVDVQGTAVAYAKSASPSPRPGKNTETKDDGVVAACDGRFATGGNSFWVSEVLEISGDVDYSTGHIDFPGDVIVQGQIKQGFKVKAGGSLTCAKTIEATEIQCGGDLVTDQGILGRAQSTVKAGGQVRAKFIENCFVEAGGDVIVSTGCLNAVISTLGAVTTGPRGVIIGGKLSAQRGVAAFQIGSSTGVRTEVCCGEDYRVQDKLAWIREKNAELSLKLKEVETSLASREKGNPIFTQMRDKLKNAIEKMNDSAKALTTSTAKNRDAVVAARGDIHLGVIVEICRVPFQVTKPLNGVRLVLDSTSLYVSPQLLGRA